MAHTKEHYRFVNGKTVHVAEHDDSRPVGHPAELHERTVIGKNKSTGTHYLRATDAEDGKQIEEAAGRLGIQVTNRRAGANHHGRVGAYSHFHVEEPEHAVALHEELKKKAGQGSAQAAQEAAPAAIEKQPVPNTYTEANIAAHDALESSELAENKTEAGRAAHALTDAAHGGTAWRKGHADTAVLHEKATAAHQVLHQETGNRYHGEAADHHEVVAAYHRKMDPAANRVSNKAKAAAEPTHESLKQHPQYTPQDYAYLKGRGYEHAEIKQKWDQEHKHGVPPTTVNKDDHGAIPDVTGPIGSGADTPATHSAPRSNSTDAPKAYAKADSTTLKANLASASGDHTKAFEAHTAAKDAHFKAAEAYKKTGDSTREQKHLNAGVEHHNKSAFHHNKGKEQAPAAPYIPEPK